MDVRIGVASWCLGNGFSGLLFSLLKRHLRPDHALVECSSVLDKSPEHLRARLMGLLESTARPNALIGLSIRPDPATLAAYRAARVPVVLVDEEAAGASTVASDNFLGGVLAAQHLSMAGRRSIGIVSGLTGIDRGYNALQRVKGFNRGLAGVGLRLPQEHAIEVPSYSRKDGVEAMVRFLNEGRRLDAVFCAAGDVCATGILAVADEYGLKVPRDLALLGYDDAPVAASSSPPLSTLRQPFERMAAEAYHLAADVGAAILERPRKVLFAPTLVARASTRRSEVTSRAA